MNRREWKVYGWIGIRSGANPKQPWNNQTREIVAARSMAEAARFAGYDSPRQLHNFGETGNAVEIAVALHYPDRGRVCWKPLDEHDPLMWKRDPLREPGDTK